MVVGRGGGSGRWELDGGCAVTSVTNGVGETVRGGVSGQVFGFIGGACAAPVVVRECGTFSLRVNDS
jgi:hypothetical protein